MLNTELTIKELFKALKGYIDVQLLAGEKGLSRKITEKFPNRPGYLFAGYDKDFPANSIQMLGNRDIGFLSSMKKKTREVKITKLLSFNPPAIIVCCGLEPPDFLLKGCDKLGISLMKTNAPSWKTSEIIQSYLEDRLAKFIFIHGDLVDVFGIGLLITGESGIGKSEAALDLVTRGHRLIADDVVCVKRKKDMLIGEEMQKEDILRHNLEIRGVGILNVAVLFGIKGIRMHKRVELQLELVRWEKGKDYTRTGLETNEVNILGVSIPYIKIPLVPGKNIATITEVIAMDFLGKSVGFYSGEIYESELIKKLRKRGEKYLKLEEDEE